MPITDKELAIAEQAGEMAEQILPELRTEALLLQTRIQWHEDNLAAWKRMSGTPETPTIKAPPPINNAPRAKRGEAHGHIAAIIADHPKFGAKQIQKEAKKRFSTSYGLSTIYRIIDVEKKKGTVV
jgi:hypothetical protein